MPAFRFLPLLALLTALTACRSSAFPDYPSDYREYAYIANAGGDTVTVLDLVHIREQASVPVGPHPRALLASTTRNEVYAATETTPASGSVAIVDAETNRVAVRLRVGAMPDALALDGTGNRLYTANGGGNSVTVLDLRARKVLGTAGVGEVPDALAVSPDNTTLVVANRASGSVSLLDLTLDALPKVRAAFPGCPGASSIAVLPDATKAFIACTGGHQVMVLGLRTSLSRARSRPSVTAAADSLLAMLDVGATPVHLAMKPDGGEIFVLNQGSDSISEISTGTSEVGSTVPIGTRPGFGVVSYDNSLLWVSNEGADTIAVYSIDDGKLINTVHGGSGPGALAFSADGHLLLAADARSGDVSLLRTFSRNLHREAMYGSLFTLLPAGREPAAIVDKAFRVKR